MKYQVAPYVHPDTGFRALPPVYEIDGVESAYMLYELNLAPATGGSTHRYQIIIVWREGQGKCQYIEDMGLSALWVAGLKSVRSAAFAEDEPTDWCHSVEEVRCLAHQLREVDMERILGLEHEDLVAGFHDRVDQYAKARRHQSVSGPLVRVERN